ncbi:polysaccharide pyruvyl transferase family protein [Helicobacter sp.]|uniref:polysaccharide pyruvyl transferase family protein n=2 Tax=Epsilonproteobacteria TaxID=3031852 RepID=UPI000BB3F823|nr:polysaccharide pyruvyl transferase family protein [Helicobacter sp.]MCI7764840.1 polysaccharide pyruvyl transferase family protein [Helicobacter sp.]
MMKNVKVFYWLGEPNFGDLLNINICHSLFRVNPVETSPEECEAVFIGSVLDDFLYGKIFKMRDYYDLYKKQPIKIWGSGFIADKNQFIRRKFFLPEIYFRRIEVYAVRGNLSLHRLKNIANIEPNNNILADPGLLSSLLIKENIAKKYKYGVIPHHSELDMKIWERFKIRDDTLLIRVDNTNPLETIRKIAECENIFSSALHGLIVADAFGIPNCRLIASNRLLGGNYKFLDYYSAYNINRYPCSEVSENYPMCLRELKSEYNISYEMVQQKQRELIESFPY